MSEAVERLKSGDVPGAYDALVSEVRKKPADAKLRIFLFQLLCVRGEWERALTQLKVCGEMDPASLPMVQSYREAIACEGVREKVFAGQTAPLVFGEPAEWLALLIQALGPLAQGNPEGAADLRARAFESAPATAGTADGEAFEWIADADMRLGPVLEIIVNGKYYWAPFATISRLKVEAPEDLRDRVWTPVEVTWANGGQVVGFVPTRYPGAAGTGRGELMLSAQTDWQDAGGDTWVGMGQRLLATDQGDLPIMDVRELVLDSQAPAAAAAPAEAGDGAD
ncbi:MAG: type VI secretion system accessory protein TagJ [Pseudomonadota bacterium]